MREIPSTPAAGQTDIGYHVADGVCTITLQRADGKGNAFSQSMLRQAKEAFEQAASDTTVKIVLLRSAHPTFCAGIDLQEMRSAMQITDPDEKHATFQRQCGALSALYHAMDSCNNPIIGVVAGKAAGSGATVLQCCDHVIADIDKARLSYPEIFFDQMPTVSLPYLQRRMNAAQGAEALPQLRHYLESGQPIHPVQGMRYGVVDEVCSSSALEEKIAAAIAAYRHGKGKRQFAPSAYTPPATPGIAEPYIEGAHHYFAAHAGAETMLDESYRAQCVEQWRALCCKEDALTKLDDYVERVKAQASKPSQERRIG